MDATHVHTYIHSEKRPINYFIVEQTPDSIIYTTNRQILDSAMPGEGSNRGIVVSDKKYKLILNSLAAFLSKPGLGLRQPHCASLPNSFGVT